MDPFRKDVTESGFKYHRIIKKITFSLGARSFWMGTPYPKVRIAKKIFAWTGKYQACISRTKTQGGSKLYLTVLTTMQECLRCLCSCTLWLLMQHGISLKPNLVLVKENLDEVDGLTYLDSCTTPDGHKGGLSPIQKLLLKLTNMSHLRNGISIKLSIKGMCIQQ